MEGEMERIMNDAAPYWISEWFIMSWWKQESKQLCNKYSMVWSESLYPSETRRQESMYKSKSILISHLLSFGLLWLGLAHSAFLCEWCTDGIMPNTHTIQINSTLLILVYIHLLLVLRSVSSAYFLLGSYMPPTACCSMHRLNPYTYDCLQVIFSLTTWPDVILCDECLVYVKTAILV